MFIPKQDLTDKEKIALLKLMVGILAASSTVYYAIALKALKMLEDSNTRHRKLWQLWELVLPHVNFDDPLFRQKFAELEAFDEITSQFDK